MKYKSNIILKECMVLSREGYDREVTPVNKEKIAKCGNFCHQILNFGSFLSWPLGWYIIYNIAQKQRISYKICQNNGDMSKFVHIFARKFKFLALKKPWQHHNFQKFIKAKLFIFSHSTWFILWCFLTLLFTFQSFENFST